MTRQVRSSPGAGDIPHKWRERHVFLSATLQDDRIASATAACIDSIGEDGLTAICARTFPRGWSLLVRLRGDFQVAGRVVRCSDGRVHITFVGRIDLDRLLRRPGPATASFKRPWTPPVASRAWRPGLRERFFA